MLLNQSQPSTSSSPTTEVGSGGFATLETSFIVNTSVSFAGHIVAWEAEINLLASDIFRRVPVSINREDGIQRATLLRLPEQPWSLRFCMPATTLRESSSLEVRRRR